MTKLCTCMRCKSERYDILVKAIRDIKQATIDGRVCDDIAWFDTITTLHDFCDQVLVQVTGDVGGSGT